MVQLYAQRNRVNELAAGCASSLCEHKNELTDSVDVLKHCKHASKTMTNYDIAGKKTNVQPAIVETGTICQNNPRTVHKQVAPNFRGSVDQVESCTDLVTITSVLDDTVKKVIEIEKYSKQGPLANVPNDALCDDSQGYADEILHEVVDNIVGGVISNSASCITRDADVTAIRALVGDLVEAVLEKARNEEIQSMVANVLQDTIDCVVRCNGIDAACDDAAKSVGGRDSTTFKDTGFEEVHSVVSKLLECVVDRIESENCTGEMTGVLKGLVHEIIQHIESEVATGVRLESETLQGAVGQQQPWMTCISNSKASQGAPLGANATPVKQTIIQPKGLGEVSNLARVTIEVIDSSPKRYSLKLGTSMHKHQTQARRMAGTVQYVDLSYDEQKSSKPTKSLDEQNCSKSTIQRREQRNNNAKIDCGEQRNNKLAMPLDAQKNSKSRKQRDWPNRSSKKRKPIEIVTSFYNPQPNQPILTNAQQRKPRINHFAGPNGRGLQVETKLLNSVTLESSVKRAKFEFSSVTSDSCCDELVSLGSDSDSNCCEFPVASNSKTICEQNEQSSLPNVRVRPQPRVTTVPTTIPNKQRVPLARNSPIRPGAKRLGTPPRNIPAGRTLVQFEHELDACHVNDIRDMAFQRRISCIAVQKRLHERYPRLYFATSLIQELVGNAQQLASPLRGSTPKGSKWMIQVGGSSTSAGSGGRRAKLISHTPTTGSTKSIKKAIRFTPTKRKADRSAPHNSPKEIRLDNEELADVLHMFGHGMSPKVVSEYMNYKFSPRVFSPESLAQVQYMHQSRFDPMKFNAWFAECNKYRSSGGVFETEFDAELGLVRWIEQSPLSRAYAKAYGDCVTAHRSTFSVKNCRGEMTLMLYTCLDSFGQTVIAGSHVGPSNQLGMDMLTCLTKLNLAGAGTFLTDIHPDYEQVTKKLGKKHIIIGKYMENKLDSAARGMQRETTRKFRQKVRRLFNHEYASLTELVSELETAKNMFKRYPDAQMFMNHIDLLQTKVCVTHTNKSFNPSVSTTCISDWQVTASKPSHLSATCQCAPPSNKRTNSSSHCKQSSCNPDVQNLMTASRAALSSLETQRCAVQPSHLFQFLAKVTKYDEEQQSRNQNKLRELHALAQPWSPYVESQWEENMTKANSHKVKFTSTTQGAAQVFEGRMGWKVEFSEDGNGATCSCSYYTSMQLPCCHICAVTMRKDEQLLHPRWRLSSHPLNKP